MTSVAIGIHLRDSSNGLRQTLASLANTMPVPDELLLLGDGTRAESDALLADSQLRLSSTDAPLGAAACFNRLCLSTTADIVIFVENGVRFGSEWLQHLIAALDADPRNGIAGPSTNRSWNEQCVVSGRAQSTDDVERMAREVRAMGPPYVELAPLHSLGDFCYAVHRRVLEVVGAADEGFGTGPCWEMEYSARALRAGFRGVWARRAYVQRAPVTHARSAEESRRFIANKHRYQEKLCGRRLRGESRPYAEHCRGADCSEFAPPDQITISIPFERTAASLEVVDAGVPLVSCVMPTRGRPEFVRQAIRYFQRQDWPARELVVVGDHEADFGERVADARVRYAVSGVGTSIGAKRNLACRMARGDYIAQWDDDDWYAPSRLRRQLTPLLSGKAELSGLHAGVIFDITRWEFWHVDRALQRHMFAMEVLGGTLTYARSVWERSPYPDSSLAEDAAFLKRAVAGGARLVKIDNDDLFVYLRHGMNSWAFQCGTSFRGNGWERCGEPAFPVEDREFYAKRTAAAQRERAVTSDTPLVSCIMPTSDRRAFLPMALALFQRQDYPARELIIVDDGMDAVEDLMPDDDSVRYLRLTQRHSIGAKRNLACEHARGDLLVHWDDDDWYADWRLRYQVAELVARGADICGVDELLYFELGADRAWRYRYPTSARPWVAGSSFCYTRELWRRNPFPDVDVGEDSGFLWTSEPKRIERLSDATFLVATMHQDNTSPKRVTDSRWRRESVREVERRMGADLDGYRRSDARATVS